MTASTTFKVSLDRFDRYDLRDRKGDGKFRQLIWLGVIVADCSGDLDLDLGTLSKSG